MSLQEIPLEQIREGSVALRPAQRDSEDYKQLVESVRVRGFIGAISVNKLFAPDGTEYYEIIDGTQRYNVCKDLGLATINCNVSVGKPKFEVLKDQIAMNAHGVDTRPVEYAKALKEFLHYAPHITVAEVAKTIGKSVGWVMARFSLLKLDAEVQKIVDEGKINVANAIALSKIPLEEQKDFAADAITEDSQKFAARVGERVKAIREERKKGGDAAPVGFTPIQHLRKPSEFKAALEKVDVIVEGINKHGISGVNDTIKYVLNWALNTDPDTLVVKEAEWKKELEEKERLKKERAEKREAEKKAKEEKDRTEANAAVAAL